MTVALPRKRKCDCSPPQDSRDDPAQTCAKVTDDPDEPTPPPARDESGAGPSVPSAASQRASGTTASNYNTSVTHNGGEAGLYVVARGRPSVLPGSPLMLIADQLTLSNP